DASRSNTLGSGSRESPSNCSSKGSRMSEVKSDLLFRKRISALNFVGTYVVLGAAAVLIWIGGFLLRDRLPLYISIIAGILPLAYAVIHTWLMRISTEYRVYEDSLEVESGIISRTIDN